jgi:hypothetical protein
MQTSQLLIAVATLAALTLAALGGRVIAQTTLPEGPNRDLVAGMCGSCHDIEMVVINGRSEERWRVTIEEMTGYGLRLSPADQALILEYLKTYLPPPK